MNSQSRIGQESQWYKTRTEPGHTTQPGVPRKLNGLSESLGQLRSIVEVLTKKLEPVLRSVEPEPPTNPSPDIESGAPCALAEDIERCRKTVDSTAWVVQSLVNRLEI